MGPSSYKLQAIYMAHTEVLRVKKWFVFTHKTSGSAPAARHSPQPHPATYHALVAQV